VHFVCFSVSSVLRESLFPHLYCNSLTRLSQPPKHPKGVPWHEALRGADWVGAILSAFGLVLTLMGIIYTTYKPSTDIHVVAPMVIGFVLLIAFGLWEQFSKTKYKLCPPEIFVTHKGREFTVPFIVAFIVTMFYYGINIIYPTMINVFYTTPTTPRHETLLLTLPGNIGLVFGALLLIAFGNFTTKFMPFRWTLITSFTGMVIWGGLLALVTPYNKGLMIAITFLEQTFFGWAQYSSIAFTFFGVHQHDLGVAGGLAGMARYAGGSLATAIYLSILTNTQASRAAVTVPQAAIAAGLPVESAGKLLATFPLGAAALEALPGMTTKALVAASTAYQWSYAHGLKITALSTLSFGGLGIIMCCLCEDIDKKMNDKVEIFLENDVHAEKNEFH
jgi:hypothetical protein